MTAPKRIQMTRGKPWRKDHPEAVIVDRRTQWGNPFVVEKGEAPDLAVFLFERWIEGNDVVDPLVPRPDVSKLRGKDLACWCPLDQPCHADVLLRIANEGGGE